MTILRIGAWAMRGGVQTQWTKVLQRAQQLGLTDVSLSAHAQDAGQPFEPFATASHVAAVLRAYAAAGIRGHLMFWPQPSPGHAKELLAYLAEVRRLAGDALVTAELDAEEQWTGHPRRSTHGAAVAAQLKAGWPSGVRLGVNGITAALPKILDLVRVADFVIPQAYTSTKKHQTRPPGTRQTEVAKAWRAKLPAGCKLLMGLAAYSQEGAGGHPAARAMQLAFDAAAAETDELRYWSLEALEGGPAHTFVKARCAALPVPQPAPAPAPVGDPDDVRDTGMALLDAVPAPPAPPASADGADVGAAVVAIALAEWQRGVREPPGLGWDRIDAYIRSAQGLAWNTADIATWKPGVPYTKNGMFAWCGAFAAWCWGGAGLGATIRRKLMPSTVRLFGGYGGLPGWHGGPRSVPLLDARAGDIGVVTKGGSTAGHHIVLIERLDAAAGLVHTLEGNASGLGPDGATYEGVVRRTRTLPTSAGGVGVNLKHLCPVSGLPQKYTLLHVYRPLPEDVHPV